MIALFNAGSQPDSFYVRDTDLGAWVEAGWLLPIDGMPGLDALDADIYPFNRQALDYGGKQYGTPYYGDIFVYMYDKKLLAKAGVTQPPVTLDQLKNAALEVKKAGIAEYPILKGYKTDVDGLSEFWSMVLASGGHLFNPALDPVFPTEDKTALGVLEWLAEAMQTWKIMDPSGLQMDQTQGRDTFLSGQGVLTSNVGNAFPRANNKAYSKRAGDIQITRFPALQDVGKGSDGLDAAVWHQCRHQAEIGKLAIDFVHGRQGQERGVHHRQGLVSALWRRLRVQVDRQRSRYHRGAEGGRL